MPIDNKRIALRGKRVTLLGRPASMPREEMRSRVTAAGGHFVGRAGGPTDVVVVGDDAPLSQRQQEWLAHAGGQGAEQISELQLLARLGLVEASADLHQLHSLNQLAQLLGVSVAKLRAFVRKGLLQPCQRVRQLELFDFRELRNAKALAQLVGTGLSTEQLKHGLDQLGSWLQDGVSLSDLECEDGESQPLVRLAGGELAETSGQLRLPFVADEPAGRTLQFGERRAGEWFETGINAEENGELSIAEDAYRRSLELDPDRAATHFNLGNVLFAQDQTERAGRCYERAVQLQDDYAEAWNNLANVRADRGQARAAIEAYRQALAADPRYADAHYNLAESLAVEGDMDGARQHWRAYLELDPFSESARELRERLKG